MTEPPPITDDDLAVVRWYECERRAVYVRPPFNPDVVSTVSHYACPWGEHRHIGRIPSRRGSGRRVTRARYAWAKHLAETAPLTDNT